MTQQEELAALRALVEEQKKELGKKDQIIERQDKRIRQLDIQVVVVGHDPGAPACPQEDVRPIDRG